MATYRHAPHDRLRLRCGHRLVVAVRLDEHVAGVAAARDRSADFVAVKHALDAGRAEDLGGGGLRALRRDEAALGASGAHADEGGADPSLVRTEQRASPTG